MIVKFERGSLQVRRYTERHGVPLRMGLRADGTRHAIAYDSAERVTKTTAKNAVPTASEATVVSQLLSS